MAFCNIRMFLCSPRKQKTFFLWIFSCVVVIYILQFIGVHVPRDQKKGVDLKSLTRDLSRYVIELPINTSKNTSLSSVLDYLCTYKGNTMEYTKRQVNNRTGEWIYKYQSFTIKDPLFINNRSKTLFYKFLENKEMLKPATPDLIDGRLYIVKNGTFDWTKIDCGYRATMSDVTNSLPVSKENWYHKLMPITSPEAGTFQHFLDGALPKVIHALHLFKDKNITMLMQFPPRDKIVLEILERLNITQDRIVYNSRRPVGADFLYFVCITPPLHPDLWQSARRLIGAPERLQVPLKEAYVVFVTRVGCHNCGRIVKNSGDLVSLLFKRYGSAFKQFKGGLTLQETIDLFGKARVILGSHGGGMYNINFAPINTTVIEFMPTLSDGTMIAASKKMIWAQAELQGQTYWRMAVPPIDKNTGDMVVDLKELEGILNVTDRRMYQT